MTVATRGEKRTIPRLSLRAKIDDEFLARPRPNSERRDGAKSFRHEIHLGDSLALWIAAIPVVNFDFRSEDELSFPSQSPWENERAVSLGSPVERANFSIPWRWSAIIEPVETSQTQDIKSRLRSRTSDSRFDSRPRMVHYPIVIGRLDTVPPRAKTLAANKLAAIAKRSIDSPVF